MRPKEAEKIVEQYRTKVEVIVKDKTVQNKLCTALEEVLTGRRIYPVSERKAAKIDCENPVEIYLPTTLGDIYFIDESHAHLKNEEHDASLCSSIHTMRRLVYLFECFGKPVSREDMMELDGSKVFTANMFLADISEKINKNSQYFSMARDESTKAYSLTARDGKEVDVNQLFTK